MLKLIGVCSLALFAAGNASAASPEAAAASPKAALKAVQTALDNLTKAVKRIEKDPPATEDLEAAFAALDPLKNALDAGAKYEAQDLDYAKAALTARKELRSKREYVEDRRAKIHIHNHRRTIDQAAAALTERMRRVEAKEPGSKDFDDARAAAFELEKAANDGRPFTKQDEQFARYLEQIDATLARQRKAIDDRWTLLSADKHRAVVKESRQAYSNALAALSKQGTDAQFEEAQRQATQLTKLLEDGKPLEAKEATYRADAERARAELAQGKKRMEELMSESRLARLKSEIQPAHKDLVNAGKAVRSRNATPEQLAEARTAAIVVRKLIEKFQPQASLSPPFAQYLNEVSQSVVEVEIELQRRSLTSATRDLTQALRTLDRRAPTDENFEEAKTALTVLEKTLETVHTKEPALSAHVGDARLLIQNAKTSLPKRRLEVEVERHKTKVEEARRHANAAMTELQQGAPSEDRIKAAESSITLLGKVLDEGAELTKKDRGHAGYASEVKKRIAELNERIARRKLMLAANNARAQLSEATSAAKAALETAKQPTSTDADIAAATKAVEAIGKALEANAALEPQDYGYGANAERARMNLDYTNEALYLATQARALRKATAEALVAGSSAVQAGEAASELRAKRANYEKALTEFKSCSSDGESMVKQNAALAKTVILLDGSPTTPREVTTQCAQKTKATEQLLAQVVGLISLEDGPKRSYEAGKALFNKNKKDEALAQFYECIASGRILEHRNPELKGRKFTAAGASMTLVEVISDCVRYRDMIKPPAKR